MFVTPPSSMQAEELNGENNRKRRQPDLDSGGEDPEVVASASPLLKKGKAEMRRTPQANLAQSKLTSSDGTLKILGSSTQANDQATSSAAGSSAEPLTADFFRSLIGENTATITKKIDKVTGDLAMLSKAVEASKSDLAAVNSVVECHTTELADHHVKMLALEDRIAMLEQARIPTPDTARQARSHDYLKARRSIRMWPIENTSSNTLWKGVGEFIHTALGVPEADLGPDDIEDVVAIPDPDYTVGNLNKEALVTFFCPRKRDMLLSRSPNLAARTDASGRPTAGLRLEIPDELVGQFKILSRFGTRLRARHGLGTKRHIKFEDLDGSLFMNIKLPGDESWSKVTVDTAKADMDRTARAESVDLLKRISNKTVSGPRERLAAPAAPNPVNLHSGPTTMGSQDARSSTQSGPKPRRAWAPREGRT